MGNTKTYNVIFDFGGNLHLVCYESDRNLRHEIEDCTASYLDAGEQEDLDYGDIIADVMTSFSVPWHLDAECGTICID